MSVDTIEVGKVYVITQNLSYGFPVGTVVVAAHCSSPNGKHHLFEVVIGGGSMRLWHQPKEVSPINVTEEGLL